MAKFEDSVGYVMSAEGGYSDHPRDPGGETFWGISIRFLESEGIDIDGDGDTDLDDVKALTRADAIAIYATKFWKPLKLHLVDSQAVATRLLDMAVNMGLKRATKVAQRAANKFAETIDFRESGEPVARLKVDGKLGTKTRGRLNVLSKLDWESLMQQLRLEHAAYYNALVKKRPDLKCFLEGWLRRAAK
jgi:lysozyme family protein